MGRIKSLWIFSILVIQFQPQCDSTEITYQVFGPNVTMIPAAFGDFNSDELTDLFVTKDEGKTIEILLGSNEAEPLLQQSNLRCSLPTCRATSLVPGDFNGDAFMDLMVTVHCPDATSTVDVHILYGQLTSLDCSTYNEESPLIIAKSEPVAVDVNNDFIIDLFGTNRRGQRGFWIFKNDGSYDFIPQEEDCQGTTHSIRVPHSNAFLDLSNDNIADLFITSGSQSSKFQFEIWKGSGKGSYSCDSVIPAPEETYTHIGQSLFLDLELKGKMDHILPMYNKLGSKLYVYANGTWHDLNVVFKDQQSVSWNFFIDKAGPSFVQTITVRGGDFNMDGYPDLIATLTSTLGTRTVLLENIACISCDSFSRGFEVKWEGFSDVSNNTVLGAFYDIFQDGILDVILVKHVNNTYKVAAYKNNLDYDANFVKVMVITGRSNNTVPPMHGPLGRRKRIFGTNLPGPRISYKTTDQDGNFRAGVNPQIPQSAYYALHLPYTMFALGRTPNFVDNITVGFAEFERDWPQIIPNSQMVIIPWPLESPGKWKVQLFVTPSKVILMSVGALLSTCLFIIFVILGLHWKERKMDRLERLQEAYRFNFEAM